MRQEINLYTAEFRLHEQPLSGRRLLMAVAVFLGLLLVMESHACWNLFQARSDLERLQKEQATATARLEALKASRPASERARLEREVESLRAEVRRREELQSIASGQNLGNAAGFSGYLEALARQASDDVSLSEIRLLDGGAYLELAGWTRRPEAVPFYLRKLRDEPSFRDVKFGVLSIRKDEAAGAQLQFSLGSSRGEGSS